MPDVAVAAERLGAPLAEVLSGDAGDAAVRAYWLGQAGFVLAHGATRVVVDPYLSDHLARKYAGTEFPHHRLMPAPIAPGALAPVSLVLCTHRHSDHMDPETLPPLVAANPGATVVVPLAERQRALDLGIPERQLRPLDAGQGLSAGPVQVEAIAAAHEELTFDAEGRCVFLGYVVRLGGLAIYHSGDCVPYPGLGAHLRRLGVDVALLPVNGRDAHRLARGVPGNFRLEEALALCAEARVRVLVGHHHGMFAFNTVDPAEAAPRLEAGFEGGVGLLARAGVVLRLEPRAPGLPARA